MSSSKLHLCSILAACLVVGCESGRHPAGEPILRDSSGVTILHASASGANAERWLVNDSADLVIGSAQAGSDGGLYKVRGVRSLTDGSIVVANEGNHQLRMYSDDGELRSVVGKRGNGPGEFAAFDWIELVNDSIWVYDRFNQRITTFDAHLTSPGAILPILRDANLGYVEVVGVFSNRDLLLAKPDPDVSEAPGRRSIYRTYHLLTRSGSVEMLLRLFRMESYTAISGDGMWSMRLPFGREASIAVSDDHWYYTAGTDYRVESYERIGLLRALYTHGDVPRAVTSDDLETYLERQRDPQQTGPGRMEHIYRDMELPDRMPAYVRVMTDASGAVWALPHPGNDSAACWHVYQSKPRFVRACMPDRFTPHEIGEDYVLGVLLDQHDVEYVARYGLRRER